MSVAEAIPYNPKSEFGFSNSHDHLRSVEQFRDAAVADGWEITPTYGSEDVSRASSLRRDGFSMQILTRTREKSQSKFSYEAQISIWGPDGLAIKPPPLYSWDAINAGLRHCNSCGADDVNTQRYSFAGRCCEKCRPEMARKHEYPGWTN